MNSIYLDNAATSFPKPPAVAAAMTRYLTDVGASVNRGVYASAQDAGMTTLLLREPLPPVPSRRPNPLYSHQRQYHGAEYGPAGLAQAWRPLPDKQHGAQRRHAPPPGFSGTGSVL